ncbi:hypothetical protein [uncultured Mobiluncus sp.]|uniref:hypothetical protein n=1 Tax=uncultured Mobiluncus sp. TaxID=293425 RepID=UPI0026211171|nr:hypothetical protein [uncultured Mobiluncus sp.]
MDADSLEIAMEIRREIAGRYLLQDCSHCFHFFAAFCQSCSQSLNGVGGQLLHDASLESIAESIASLTQSSANLHLSTVSGDSSRFACSIAASTLRAASLKVLAVRTAAIDLKIGDLDSLTVFSFPGSL